ncbi:MAG: hypothetical protein KGK07_16755 [Chloroflexota bacterium]|nr:hypothetical protein [Chloroflexota bacterium]
MLDDNDAPFSPLEDGAGDAAIEAALAAFSPEVQTQTRRAALLARESSVSAGNGTLPLPAFSWTANPHSALAAPPLYSAVCPRCGQILWTSLTGNVFFICSRMGCTWSGTLLLATPSVRSAHYPPPGASSASLPAPLAAVPSALAAATTPSADEDADEDASDAADTSPGELVALREDATLYGSEVAAELTALTARVGEAALMALRVEQCWDRLQQALDALYTTLGSARMGVSAPSLEAVADEVVRLGVEQMLLLHAAERLQTLQALQAVSADGDGAGARQP